MCCYAHTWAFSIALYMGICVRRFDPAKLHYIQIRRALLLLRMGMLGWLMCGSVEADKYWIAENFQKSVWRTKNTILENSLACTMMNECRRPFVNAQPFANLIRFGWNSEEIVCGTFYGRMRRSWYYGVIHIIRCCFSHSSPLFSVSLSTPKCSQQFEFIKLFSMRRDVEIVVSRTTYVCLSTYDRSHCTPKQRLLDATLRRRYFGQIHSRGVTRIEFDDATKINKFSTQRRLNRSVAANATDNHVFPLLVWPNLNCELAARAQAHVRDSNRDFYYCSWIDCVHSGPVKHQSIWLRVLTATRAPNKSTIHNRIDRSNDWIGRM